MTAAPSPAPWSYDYNPYRRQDGREIPAFEIYDAHGDKVFDTNEDTPCELQEQNARLAAAAPEMRQALLECVRLLADFVSEIESDERSVYRQAVAAIATADGRRV
jgi:hypothetical protein